MDYRLENNIAFDKSKYSENFGKPYLRTKAIAIKELNQSIYQEPSVLGTDKYDWNLRTSEYNKYIPTRKSHEILTVPTPFVEKSVLHLAEQAKVEGAYSNYEKEVTPFEHTSRSLKKSCAKLKHANDYLAWQHRRFHSKGGSVLEEPLTKSIEYDEYYYDHDQLLDKNSSVFTSNMKYLEDDHSDDEGSVGQRALSMTEAGDDEAANCKKASSEEQKEDLPLFIEKYDEETVAALMKQIQSLSNIEDAEDASFFDPYINEQVQHHSQAQQHMETLLRQRSSKKRLDTVEEVGEHDDTDSAAVETKKQTWQHGYNPRFQRADPNEDMTKLNAKTTFQLTDKITITMGHMDRALYKNSRKFGIKFDEKIQRKREILAKEKNIADRINASLQQNDTDFVPYFSSTGGSESGAGGGYDYVIAGMQSHHGQSHAMNSSTRNHTSTTPTLPPISTSYQMLIAAGVVPAANTVRVAPVSKRVNLFHAAPEEQAVFDLPSPNAATGTSVANAFNSSGSAANHRGNEEDSVCLTRSVVTNSQQPTSVLFDLDRDGKLLGISLKSEVEVERPKSADALRKMVKDAANENALNEKVNSTYRSMRAVLAERRKLLRKPKEKKNLMQVDYIPEDEAQFERQTLIFLYEQCNGQHWYNSTNWCTDAPVRTWYGVGLSVEGYVFELDLSDNNLSGEFPDSVAQFSRIESLNLNNNRLRGELPNHALCRMANLEVLSVENNRLSGEVSFYMLSNLPKLSDLWLGRNKFTGSIGDDIGGMTNLVNLCMYGNKISGSIPESICKLHKLEFLSLGNNRLTGVIPPQIINLHQLRNLSLHNNQLSGEVPDFLQSIPYLEDIELFNNNFTGYVPSTMKELRTHKYA